MSLMMHNRSIAPYLSRLFDISFIIQHFIEIKTLLIMIFLMWKDNI